MLDYERFGKKKMTKLSPARAKLLAALTFLFFQIGLNNFHLSNHGSNLFKPELEAVFVRVVLGDVKIKTNRFNLITSS